MTGVEPASEAWEASILPMNYIRKNCSNHVAQQPFKVTMRRLLLQHASTITNRKQKQQRSQIPIRNHAKSASHIHQFLNALLNGRPRRA